MARSNTGELVKAVLIDTTTGSAHPVAYNPEELRLDQGNQFAEIAIPGLDASPLQYVRGRNRTLSMDLLFDTYESGTDVRTRTGPIVRLLNKNPATLAPPVLLFSFGRLQLRCVLTDAAERFTMFDRDGTPVRCSMSVKLQEYVDLPITVEQGLTGLAGLAGGVVSAIGRATVRPGTAAVHVVAAGDTLSAIAGAYLGDPGRWREIARANDIVDPLGLVPGAHLAIPEAGS
ncbi:CIS tube protein [Kineosporia babensis]|uniref:LysM peptidoglycan-binding domain-containing protein n=1 Tax=Kineosporia babensis TaxID=499548 RepID=A0A9X1SX86_9ACTN|nr:LysM peptidoglycan-binding domain-containing protein [Kineosporia babensis]MCD5315942.1 LysM peptidoglycan-binding domain-containing protein [Kineosporia babensis]